MKPEPKKIHRARRSVEDRLENIVYSEALVEFMTVGHDVVLPKQLLFQLLKRAYDMGKRDTLNKQGDIK